jgi:hypothetical protein
MRGKPERRRQKPEIAAKRDAASTRDDFLRERSRLRYWGGYIPLDSAQALTTQADCHIIALTEIKRFLLNGKILIFRRLRRRQNADKIFSEKAAK